MKNYFIIIILTLIISYSLCDFIPEHNYGLRRYFCKNPFLSVAVFFILFSIYLLFNK
jgi:hypothetical protein